MLSSPPYSAKGTKYSRSAFLGSLIHNQFYLHPILPHSVELWLISSTLTIWFSLNTFCWPLPDLCCACYKMNNEVHAYIVPIDRHGRTYQSTGLDWLFTTTMTQAWRIYIGSLKRKEFWHFSLINCIFSVSLNKAFATKYLIAIFASPYNHSFRLARGILLNLQCANRFCNLITKYSVLVFSTILIKMLDKNIREYSKIRFENT